MNYYAPDSWYEQEVEYSTPKDNGYLHEDDLPNIDHCKDMLAGILQAIYKTGDIAKLEDCLDELTSQFDMKIPENTPVLEKSGSVRTNRTLDSWVMFNQEYNENLMNIATS